MGEAVLTGVQTLVDFFIEYLRNRAKKGRKDLRNWKQKKGRGHMLDKKNGTRTSTTLDSLHIRPKKRGERNEGEIGRDTLEMGEERT